MSARMLHRPEQIAALLESPNVRPIPPGQTLDTLNELAQLALVDTPSAALGTTANPEPKPPHFSQLTRTDWKHVYRLEANAYPLGFVIFNEGDFRRHITKRNSSDLSFFIHNPASAAEEYVGYCIAHSIRFKSGYERRPGEHIAHIVSLTLAPSAQRKGLGTMALGEVLTRARQKGIDRVEFDARETTSYPIVTNPERAAKILQRHGYLLFDHGLAGAYETGELCYFLHLQRVW